jgi:arylsulfatase A
VAEAIDWLASKRDKAKPFFLAVWTHEPHLPIETDPRFQKSYQDLPEDFRQHYGNVTQLDHAFGRLMKALDKQGLAETTLVVFTADNGPEGDGTKGRTRGSAGGLRGRKRSLYEGGIRVLGIVRWPGHLPPGTTVDVPVVGSDLLPTILGVAGVKPPRDRVIDGVDVLPVLAGRTQSAGRKAPLYWRLDMAPAEEDLQMALRDGDWKLLASRDFSHVELYNLRADPQEKRDLAAKEAARSGTMRETLAKLNAEIEREGPDWWKRLSPNGGGPIKEQ